ncbi:MAG: hypothetical protein AAGF19_07085 [Pseudomonadota bacterium]
MIVSTAITRLLMLAVLLAAGLVAEPALADQMPRQHQAQTPTTALAQAGPGLGLEAVVRQVTRQFGGRLIDARLEAGEIYDLVWELPQNRIARIRVDARTGAVLSVN